jgi:hypothetical protein
MVFLTLSYHPAKRPFVFQAAQDLVKLIPFHINSFILIAYVSNPGKYKRSNTFLLFKA